MVDGLMMLHLQLQSFSQTYLYKILERCILIILGKLRYNGTIYWQYEECGMSRCTLPEMRAAFPETTRQIFVNATRETRKLAFSRIMYRALRINALCCPRRFQT